MPGVSRMNLVKFRSRTGSSVICWVEKVVATSARSVLSSWLSTDSTVTTSDIWPSSSATSTLVWESTLTFTAETTLALKPVSSAFTS